jgi:2,3-bisphosphoglycerate-dependent phosphoglycerate mutase
MPSRKSGNLNRRIAAIIRHGHYKQIPDAPSAHQPYPLTPDGEIQAREAEGVIREMMALHDWRLDPVIDCSQMLRSWQTARIIADNLAGQLPVELQLRSFDALAERSVGSVANLTTNQIEQILHQDPRYPEPPADWKANSSYRLPFQGAESLLESGERVAGHLLKRLSGVPASEVDTLKLFVGHGASFRHAAFHLGVIEYEEIRRLSMYHGRPVFLELQDDGCWRHIEGAWKVRKSQRIFND